MCKFSVAVSNNFHKVQKLWLWNHKKLSLQTESEALMQR
uniref:Uncharacterized protein n=1 Tax=Lotus japonicus TaxID=34305 RepID=I3SJ28_LOTJA|nr:unknown [Lotus japonicus]